MSNNNFDILLFASKEGHINMVTKLLKDYTLDPSQNNNEAIKIALNNNHINIINNICRKKLTNNGIYDNFVINYKGS